MSTATESAGELLATAADLWPGSDVVPAGTATDGRPVRARYAVLGSGDVPTVLVPVEPRAAISACFGRASSATDWRTRIARRVAGGAARVAPQLMRQQVEVRGGEPGLDEHLSEILGDEVSFSISIGSARVNRKPVLQLFDAEGRCRAFAKVGWSPHTCVDVAAEGRALAVLGERQFHLVIPPRLIARTWWNDHPVVVTEPLGTPRHAHRRTSGHRRWQPPVSAMRELGSRFASPPGPLADAPWWTRQWRTVGGIADPVTRERLARAMDQVALHAGSTVLQWGAWHGDWTPWNMLVDGPRVLLWDWERFEREAPAGMDLFHFVLNVASPGRPLSPETVLRALSTAMDYAATGHVPPAPDDVVARLYLVAILTRYLRLAEVAGGDRIAPRANQVLIALEALCT